VPYYDIIWNPEPDGNVEHIAEHDWTPDDVEAVLLHPVAEDISRSSGRPMVYGFTPDGRYIVVVYEEIDDHTLYPVTAYVVEIWEPIMTRKIGKRIYRPATVEEQERHKRIREQVQEELPDIEQRVRQKLAEAMQRGVPIQHTIALLKSERLKKGLSLADMKARTGIERSTLSRLENDAEANPTVDTLTKYADAVGKKVLVVLADTDEGEA
jgi:DNA-binding phage protein